jgi:hypothetical protein
VTVPRASQRPRELWVTTYQPCCITASKSQHIKTRKGCVGKGCWPHPRVRSLSRGGPGYPRVQALSQDNSSRSRLRASPGPPRVPAARDSTGVTTCPSGLGQLRGWHVSLRLQHPPCGAGQLRSCHVSPGLCGLQANKQISSGDPAIMIFIGADAPVSFKALRDKGCSAHSQGVHQADH